MQGRRVIPFAVLTCASACGPSDLDVTLAELDAVAHIERDGSKHISFGPATSGNWDPCRVLPSGTQATLDGIVADENSPGGVYEDYYGEHCGAPNFRWYDPAPPSGMSTIEVSDGRTTWTFEVWYPFEVRELSLVSHPTGQIRPGDRVTARTAFAEDGPLTGEPFVRIAFDTAPYFLYPEPPDVVLNGHELSFTMPAEVPVGEIELWLEAEPTIRVDRCDAPDGCDVDGLARDISMFDVVQ